MTLLEVARIIKPHGLTGEVVVDLVTNRTERLEPGTVLVCRIPTKAPVAAESRLHPETLTVTKSRPHQGRFLVYFEGIIGRDAAEALRSLVLFAEPLDDDDALFVHELIGKSVVDVDGTERGTVTAIEANPASDLLVIDDRHYVPVRFIVSHEDQIVIDPPEGLFSFS